MSAAPAPPPEPSPLPPGFAEGVGLTAEHEAALEIFRGLLVEWNERLNLVGASTLEDFRGRHVIDSAQLLWQAPEARAWADLGTGAGFPGLVLAILLKGRPGAQVHLVESIAKKCRFLETVAETLDLPVTVHNARAETLAITVDVVAARACAPLTRLFGFALPYMARGAAGLFLKGQDAEREIAEARKAWRFDPQVLPSLSDPRGRIVRIERLSRAR